MPWSGDGCSRFWGAHPTAATGALDCSRHLSSVCGRVAAVVAVPSLNCCQMCVEAARCSRSRQARNCKLRNSAAVPQAAAVAFGQNLEGSGRETASISCFFVIPGLFLLPVIFHSLSTVKFSPSRSRATEVPLWHRKLEDWLTIFGSSSSQGLLQAMDGRRDQCV